MAPEKPLYAECAAADASLEKAIASGDFAAIECALNAFSALTSQLSVQQERRARAAVAVLSNPLRHGTVLGLRPQARC